MHEDMFDDFATRDYRDYSRDPNQDLYAIIKFTYFNEDNFKTKKSSVEYFNDYIPYMEKDKFVRYVKKEAENIAFEECDAPTENIQILQIDSIEFYDDMGRFL
jgi:hypothetical protein